MIVFSGIIVTDSRFVSAAANPYETTATTVRLSW